MADKSNGEDTATGTEALDALFDNTAKSQESSIEKLVDSAHDQTPEEFDPANYPKQFMKDGELDPQKLHKSWYDTQKAYTQSRQEISNLKKANLVPEDVNEYINQIDTTELRKLAPNAFPDKQSAVENLHAWLGKLREAGMTPAQARLATQQHYAHLETTMSPEVDPQEARRKAAAAHPNGPMILEDVKTWLAGKARVSAFTAGQLQQIDKLLQSSDGIALLGNLARTSTGAPPSIPGSMLHMSHADMQEEKQNALDALAADPDEWSKNQSKIIARARRVLSS